MTQPLRYLLNNQVKKKKNQENLYLSFQLFVHYLLSCFIAPSLCTHPLSFLFLRLPQGHIFLSLARGYLLYSLPLGYQFWWKATLLLPESERITCLLAADDIMALAVGESGSIRTAPQQTGPLSTFNTAPLLIQPRTSKRRSETLLVWCFSKNSHWQRRSSYCCYSALLPRTSVTLAHKSLQIQTDQQVTDVQCCSTYSMSCVNQCCTDGL